MKTLILIAAVGILMAIPEPATQVLLLLGGFVLLRSGIILSFVPQTSTRGAEGEAWESPACRDFAESQLYVSKANSPSGYRLLRRRSNSRIERTLDLSYARKIDKPLCVELDGT